MMNKSDRLKALPQNMFECILYGLVGIKVGMYSHVFFRHPGFLCLPALFAVLCGKSFIDPRLNRYCWRNKTSIVLGWTCSAFGCWLFFDFIFHMLHYSGFSSFGDFVRTIGESAGFGAACFAFCLQWSVFVIVVDFVLRLYKFSLFGVHCIPPSIIFAVIYFTDMVKGVK